MSETTCWNRDRLAVWIESNRPRLVLLIERRMGDQLRSRFEAEDVLQEAATRALQAVEKDKFEGADPYPWFAQIVERQIVDAYRFHFGAQKRDAGREVLGNQPVGGGAEGRQADFFDLLAASFTTPSQAFSKNVKLERLQLALRELPEEARNAIQWRYMDGLPGQEIADRLGKSHGAVRVLLTRTLKKLEEVLSDDGT